MKFMTRKSATKKIMSLEMKTFLCGLSLALMASLVSAAESQPPNIVLILSDDQSYTDYSFMGHPAIETPNLDQLASESVVFRRGYVPTALCRPALMTLATGLYSHQNKTTGNNPARTAANGKHAKDQNKHINELLISHIDETGALPQWLAKRGYVSHQSGKWWEGSYQRGGFTDGMTKGFARTHKTRAELRKLLSTGWFAPDVSEAHVKRDKTNKWAPPIPKAKSKKKPKKAV